MSAAAQTSHLCSEKEKGEGVGPDIPDVRLAVICPLAGTVSHGHRGWEGGWEIKHVNFSNCRVGKGEGIGNGCWAGQLRVVASIPFNLFPSSFFFLHYFHLFIKYVHFCPGITLREPCTQKHINTELFTKHAAFWRVPNNVLVDFLITVSRMITPITSELSLYSIYSSNSYFQSVRFMWDWPFLSELSLNFKQIASRKLSTHWSMLECRR